MTAGKGWASAGFLLGIAVSVAGNVAHTWHPSPAALALAGKTADQWQPETGSQFAAAFFPLALLVTVEVLARVQWPRTWGWSATRYGGTALVAGVAAIVSYLHLRALLLAYGEDPLTALIGPLSVDGLMVVSGFALIAVGRTVSVVEAEEVRVPKVDPEPDPHQVRAAEVFAEEIAAGEVPSFRRIKRELRVGQLRAEQVRMYLAVLAAG